MPKITRDHVKTVTTAVVSLSVSAVVKTVITQNTEPKSNLHAAELYVGAFVLGGMIARHATNYTDQKIDEVAATLDQIKARMPQQ